MQQHILVPLDGSSLAEAVLPESIALAHATHSMLTLLQVVPPAEFESVYGTISLPESWYEELLESVHHYLMNVADHLQTDGLVVQTKVLEGDPATQIVSYAEQDSSVILIALTHRGLTGGDHGNFGSVVDKIIHVTSKPLLLLQPYGMASTLSRKVSYQTVGIPLDGSAVAEQALDEARVLAHSLGLTLVLISVVSSFERSTAYGLGDSPSWMATIHQTETERRTNYLGHKAYQLRSEGLTVRTEVAVGQVAKEILRLSTQQHLDLIVMALRGRSDSSRLWLGSVVLKVVQGADLPVILVPKKESTTKLDLDVGQKERWPLGLGINKV